MAKKSTDSTAPRRQAVRREAARRHAGTVDRLRTFVGDFTDGLNRRDLGRLFDEEASRAVFVLAGEDSRDEPRDRGLRRLLRLAHAFVLGLAFMLPPARRLLFAAALFCPILGMIDFDLTYGPTRLHLDFSPFWYLASIAGLTLLLALELVDRLRVRDELEVARQLQRELLPQVAPPIPGYRLAHSYRTANEIGGDYYDFLPLADGRLAIAVGDASGHGISAGLLMAIANATLMTAIELDPRPEAVLQLLNRVLRRSGGRRAFMTLFYGLLDPATGELEYAAAGHPFPLLRRVDGAVEELGEGSLPLGLRAEIDFVRRRAMLAPGDLLVLYSDGLPEAVGGDNGDAFGFDRVAQLLSPAADAQAVHDRIVAAVTHHLGERPLSDDLTLVVLERLPPLPE